MQNGFQVLKYHCWVQVNGMTRYQVPREETSINLTSISEQVYWGWDCFEKPTPESLHWNAWQRAWRCGSRSPWIPSPGGWGPPLSWRWARWPWWDRICWGSGCSSPRPSTPPIPAPSSSGTLRCSHCRSCFARICHLYRSKEKCNFH